MVTSFIIELPPIGDIHNIHINPSNVDCEEEFVPCDPSVINRAQCIKCKTIGSRCVDVSGTKIVSLDGNNDDESSDTFPPQFGICLPSENIGDFNPHTTSIVVGVKKIGDRQFAHATTHCKDNDIVTKRTDDDDDDGLYYFHRPCDKIVACQPNGLIRHPFRDDVLITDSSQIDFDLNQTACQCPEGYTSSNNQCKKNQQIPRCQVYWASSAANDRNYKCVCNPALQINATAIVDESFDTTYSAYSQENLRNVRFLLDEILQGCDMCLPLPGVTSKNAAFSYNCLAEKTAGVTPQRSYGGHLVESLLLVKDGILDTGVYRQSVYARGGVITTRGKGHVSAYLEGMDYYNNKDYILSGGGEPPNSSIRVMRAAPFGVHGLGEESGDHALGLLASAGRVYPGGVYSRSGGMERTADDRQITTFISSSGHDSFMQRINDPGIVAGAFLVPRIFYRGEEESSVGNNIPLSVLNHRRAANAYCLFDLLDSFIHKDYETDRTGYLRNLRNMFPSSVLYEGITERFDEFELFHTIQPIGGLLIEPTNIVPREIAWRRGYVEEELWANSPLLTNFYAGGKHLFGGLLATDHPYLEPTLPVGPGIVANFNSHASGASLQQHPNGSPVTYLDCKGGEPIDFVATQVHGTENYVKDCSVLSLPPNMPCGFPQLVEFSQRHFSSSDSTMARYGHQGGGGGGIENYLAKEYNYQAVNVPVCHPGFYETRGRKVGTGLYHPLPCVMEAFVQRQSCTNIALVKDGANDDSRLSLMHFTQHCANYIPSLLTHYKFLLNGDAWMGASLNQYLSIFTFKDEHTYPCPPSKAPHVGFPYARNTTAHPLLNPLKKIKDDWVYTEGCFDTTEALCRDRMQEDSLDVAAISESALHSRCTRYTPYILEKRLPLSTIERYTAYFKIINNYESGGVVKDLAHLFLRPIEYTRKIPHAPNAFVATPYNLKSMNYLYGRQLLIPFPPISVSNSFGIPPADCSPELRYDVAHPRIYANAERTRLLESMVTVGPNTNRCNMLNSRDDGPGDIILQLGVTVRGMPGVSTFVHNYPIKLPSRYGYECGQVVAEGTCGFGGFLTGYRPWHLNNPRGWLDGFTSRQPVENYDGDFFHTNFKNPNAVFKTFVKHYGSGMLFKIAGSSENNTASFPMCSRYSYGAYPFTRQMTDQVSQPRAVMGFSDMGATMIHMEETALNPDNVGG